MGEILIFHRKKSINNIKNSKQRQGMAACRGNFETEYCKLEESEKGEEWYLYRARQNEK